LSMYKINLSNSGNITFEGEDVDVTTTTIPISSGWNWISYLPQEAMDINTALASIDGSAEYIKDLSGFSDYYPGYGWYGTLEELNPHDGYMINATESTTLTYPERYGSGNSNNEYVQKTNHNHWNFNYHNYEYNSSIMMSLDLETLNVHVDDQIGAFINDKCVGIANGQISPFDSKILFPMMIYGDNQEKVVSFKYYNSQSNKEIDLIEQITYKPDTYSNDALDPFSLTDIIPYTYSLSDAYPNPFNPSTTIEYSLAENVNDLNISVYDIRGRLVESILNESMYRGEHKIIWNGERYSSGAYFIKMNTGTHMFVKKIMLIK